MTDDSGLIRLRLRGQFDVVLVASDGGSLGFAVSLAGLSGASLDAVHRLTLDKRRITLIIVAQSAAGLWRRWWQFFVSRLEGHYSLRPGRARGVLSHGHASLGAHLTVACLWRGLLPQLVAPAAGKGKAAARGHRLCLASNQVTIVLRSALAEAQVALWDAAVRGRRR